MNNHLLEGVESLPLKPMSSDAKLLAQCYLHANAKRMHSVTNTDVCLKENFTQLIILEATGDSTLVDYIKYKRRFNFFVGPGILTDACYPDDFDTTALGLTISDHTTEELKHSVMDEMLQYKNKQGIIQTYFDSTRPRIDAVVCCNVLSLFYANGRGSELDDTLNWVYSVLKHREYIQGTRYYCTADSFLFFLSRLFTISPHVHARFEDLFVTRIRERFGTEGDALALAMRVIAAVNVGILDSVDYEHLLPMQRSDGSWETGWVYRYGKTGILIGSKGLTTALAVNAIEAYEKLKSSSSQTTST